MAQAPDIVIKNSTIVTMDPNRQIFQNGAVAVLRDQISYVGTVEQAPSEAAKTIDAKGGIVMPGLINSHTHAAMTLLRGLADDLPLMEWLTEYIFPIESRMDQDFVYTGALLACAEMIRSGTTTFCDMYLFEDAVAQAAQKAGIRCLLGEVLFDFPSPNYGPPEKGLAYSEKLIQRYQGDSLISIAVEPHAPYTCGPELLKSCGVLADRYDVPLIIHLAETEHERQEVLKKYGCPPVDYLDGLGLLSARLIADHGVVLDALEIERLAACSVSVVHNPESNMKLASGIAPLPQLLKAGIRVGLGTDGCASNNNLDMFSEMKMAALLHKANTLDSTVMPAQTVLEMATIGGAGVLGVEEKTGSLEVGKKADLIVVDTARPHLTPMYDPISHLVYAVHGGDVVHSLINGQIVMEDRQLLSLDLAKILKLVQEKAGQAGQWLAQKDNKTGSA